MISTTHQESIGVAIKTIKFKYREGRIPEQAIRVKSFQGFVSYLNKSQNWIKINEGWKNISGQLIITNGKKGFLLQMIH